MKSVYFLLASLLVLTSCSKDKVTDPIIEPHPSKVTLDDTLYNGSFLGVRIGASPANVHDSLQQGWNNNKKIAYLQVANFYNNLDSVSGRIPFYNSIRISEAVNITVPIQIYFANNHVQSIYLSSNNVNNWPANEGAASSISVGDSRDNIYSKLQNISNNSTYAQHFGSISLGSKDFSKPFDPAMTRSALWYFSSPIDSQRFYVVEVFFTAGVVTAIHRVRYEPL